jgi:hypothetical protein
MATRTAYPKVKTVVPQPGMKLLVEFENGECRTYDCTPLLRSGVFRPLRDEAFFRSVHADPHGYGVVWNDDIDLAESELWVNGAQPGPGSCAG